MIFAFALLHAVVGIYILMALNRCKNKRFVIIIVKLKLAFLILYLADIVTAVNQRKKINKDFLLMR